MAITVWVSAVIIGSAITCLIMFMAVFSTNTAAYSLPINNTLLMLQELHDPPWNRGSMRSYDAQPTHSPSHTPRSHPSSHNHTLTRSVPHNGTRLLRPSPEYHNPRSNLSHEDRPEAVVNGERKWAGNAGRALESDWEGGIDRGVDQGEDTTKDKDSQEDEAADRDIHDHEDRGGVSKGLRQPDGVKDVVGQLDRGTDLGTDGNNDVGSLEEGEDARGEVQPWHKTLNATLRTIGDQVMQWLEEHAKVLFAPWV